MKPCCEDGCHTWLDGHEVCRCSAGNVVHVYPLDDLVAHDTGFEGCVCAPKVEHVKRPDGGSGWVYTHSSLDGRELVEGSETE